MMLQRKLGKIASTLIQIGCAGCVLHCIDRYVGSLVLCSGDSMIPTIFSNDIVLAENISVWNKTLQKGDIIIAKSPTDPEEFVCKRLVAMEGDRVRDENANTHYVPKGHVWLEGDNRSNSKDSKQYGPVPMGLLTRRVFLRVWPLLDFGPLKHPSER